MKVAMLKFASTNKNTSPLYTGMAGEMAFVSQGHLWRRTVTGEGSFGCIEQFLPIRHHHKGSLIHSPPAIQPDSQFNIRNFNCQFQQFSVRCSHPL